MFGALGFANGHWLIHGDLPNSCKHDLKLGFVVGNRLLCIPIGHIHCHPTQKFVALRFAYKVEGCTWGWRWFKAIEYQACKVMSFRFNVSSSFARGHGLDPITYRVLMSISRFVGKPACYSRRMCKVPEAAGQRCKR